jgi:hypothetical protein
MAREWAVCWFGVFASKEILTPNRETGGSISSGHRLLSQRISADTPFDTAVSIYFISERIKSLFVPVPLLSFVYQ